MKVVHLRYSLIAHLRQARRWLWVAPDATAHLGAAGKNISLPRTKPLIPQQSHPFFRIRQFIDGFSIV